MVSFNIHCTNMGQLIFLVVWKMVLKKPSKVKVAPELNQDNLLNSPQPAGLQLKIYWSHSRDHSILIVYLPWCGKEPISILKFIKNKTCSFLPSRVETCPVSCLINYRSSIVLIYPFTFQYSPFLPQWEPRCFILVQVTKNTEEQVSLSWIRNKLLLSPFRFLCQLWTTWLFRSHFIAGTTHFPSRGFYTQLPLWNPHHAKRKFVSLLSYTDSYVSGYFTMSPLWVRCRISGM